MNILDPKQMYSTSLEEQARPAQSAQPAQPAEEKQKVINPKEAYQTTNIYIENNNRLTCLLSKTFKGYNFLLSSSPIIHSLYFGTKGKTKEELIKTFNFPEKIELFKEMTKVLPKLHQASIILVPQTTKLKENFIKKVYPFCYIYRFNNLSKDKINKFISSKTNNMINQLIPDNILRSDSKLLLLNAIYFKQNWVDGFDKKLTCKLPFYRENKASRLVDMMCQTNNFKYHEDQQTQYLEMPYQDEYLFGIILPKNQNYPKINNLSHIKLLKKTGIKLTMPKFTLRHKMELCNYFRELGINYIFSPKLANIKGISENDLWISNIIYESVLIIDEEGKNINSNIIEGSVNMNCDHPFIYYVRNAGGLIVLIGIYI